MIGKIPTEISGYFSWRVPIEIPGKDLARKPTGFSVEVPTGVFGETEKKNSGERPGKKILETYLKGFL